mmetsp:Transcript_4670/g.6907  ORF Transcript_4670/g.6907 Transcript_4670/m.6907 type:complete len:96 (+) Transcript_4670:125-412(+)
MNNPTIMLPYDDPFTYQPCSPRNVYLNGTYKGNFNKEYRKEKEQIHSSPIMKYTQQQQQFGQATVKNILKDISNHMVETSIQNTGKMFQQMQLEN